jgi:hypothetical protein
MESVGVAAVPRPATGRDSGLTLVSLRGQSLCGWCGLVYLVLLGISLPLSNMLPPPSPNLSATAFAHALITNRTEFRIGVVMGAIAMPLYGVLCAGVGAQLKRIEGRYSPLSNIQTGMAMITVLEVWFPYMFFLAAAYRPERSAHDFQLLTDIGLLPFVGGWMLIVFQWLATAILIFQDERDEPAFPRWAGYLNLWFVFSSLPSSLLFFVHSGPFAWNGLFSWWLAGQAFGGWTLVMSILLIRATRRDRDRLRAGLAFV